MLERRGLQEPEPERDKKAREKFTQPASGFILTDRGEVPPDNDARIAAALAGQAEEEPEAPEAPEAPVDQ